MSHIHLRRSFALTAAFLLGFLGATKVSADELVQVAQIHVPAQVASAKLLGRMTPSPQMTIDFLLPLRNQQTLTDELARISDPSDPNYGKYLTNARFIAEFGPSQADVEAVTAFAKSSGLTVASVSANRTLIQVKGSSSAIESAFHLKLNNYQAESGRIFFAPDREPVFPASVARKIVGLIGLDNSAQARPAGRMTPVPQPWVSFAPLLSPDGARAGSFYSSGENGLSPSDTHTIYNFPSVTDPGQGQTIAVMELCGYTASDIASYDSHYFPSIPTVPLQNVLVDGYDGSPGSDPWEVTADIELVIAMCPYASKIEVYEATNSYAGIADDYARIASDDSADIVSTSWSATEFGTSAASFSVSENQSFMQMAMQGQSIFACSYDNGAYDNGTPSSAGTLSVGDPCNQPYVCGVGATYLSDTSSEAYASETAWGDASDTRRSLSGAGSGGGISAWWAFPSYQDGFTNSNNLGSTTQRNVPDVSLFGDYDEGGYSTFFQGIFQDFNGTSAATPLWAGLAALVNQARATHSGNVVTPHNLGFINPILYSLAGQPTKYVSDFHDVTIGNNLYYPAVTGYDLATGLGTPKGTALYSDLVAYGPKLDLSHRFDFNGNGIDDLLFQNSNGQTLVWYMDDTALVQKFGTVFTTVSPPWHIQAVADINSDGHPDLLWWNSSTGECLFWEMTGTLGTTVLQYESSFASISDTSWHPVSMADFDGDSHPDILWENFSTGQLLLWYMNGNTIKKYGSAFTTLPANWIVAGTADFNQDGHPDLLLENTKTGQVLVWYLTGALGTTVLTYGSTFATVSDTNWSVVSTGEFLEDGHPDLTWHNKTTGATDVWLMGGSLGTTVTSYDGNIGSVPTTWSIVGVH